MSLCKLQGKVEKQKGFYYEFDSDDAPLGEGGMGKVYKGRCVDEATGAIRDVAIKFLYSDLSPYAIEKARREATIHFRHNNLIEMLGFVETEEKSVLDEPVHRYHVVSELLEGVSLQKLFEGNLNDQQGNFVPYAGKLFHDYQHDANHFAIEITKNILSGLITMHDAGYIHRDIDPTNIMITTDGHIKLIDFGIAKKINALTSHDKNVTHEGHFVGKPEYAAPELALGAVHEQNQTTDIYAVGILLFQCIVGHVPFEGSKVEILQKQLHSSLPSKLIKHKGLRAVIVKATAKSSAKRFQSAAEFRVALEHINTINNGFEWKPLYTYAIGGGIALCTITATLYLKRAKPSQDPITATFTTINTKEVITQKKNNDSIAKLYIFSIDKKIAKMNNYLDKHPEKDGDRYNTSESNRIDGLLGEEVYIDILEQIDSFNIAYSNNVSDSLKKEMNQRKDAVIAMSERWIAGLNAKAEKYRKYGEAGVTEAEKTKKRANELDSIININK